VGANPRPKRAIIPRSGISTREINTGVGFKCLFTMFESWSAEDFANELVYQEFGFYLSKIAAKAVVKSKTDGEQIAEDEDGVPLAISSARQYFSNFMQAVIQKHRDSELPFYKQFENLQKGESIPWIKRIRDDMRNETEREMMAAGIPTMLKPRGISRALLERMIDKLIDEGNTFNDIGQYI